MYPSIEEKIKECREKYREAIRDIRNHCQGKTPVKFVVSSDSPWYKVLIEVSLNCFNLRDECNTYAMEQGIFQEKMPGNLNYSIQHVDIVFMVM